MTNSIGVIVDLDGTLLDTETLCFQISQELISERFGKQLTKEIALLAIGKRPLESWAVVCEQLELPASAQELLDQSEPLLRDRWQTVKALPGARRLMRHLAKHNIPIAVATSTSRESFNRKMKAHAELRECFAAVVCGDEVESGKPAPDTFLKAAELLKIDPSQCLAFEDAPSGIQSAAAAGMKVLAVPSILDKKAYTGCECRWLASLLAFNPADDGLPPFDDLVAGTVPLDAVWRLKGPVVKGSGRGSRELGIPTANLSEASIGSALGAAVTGIYYGWASVGSDAAAYQMVMSVGFNPFYKNSVKTCEPWLLHEFAEDFYGEELRLVVCGYVRPEADFTTLDALKARILEDADVTRLALKHESLLAFSKDPFLTPAPA